MAAKQILADQDLGGGLTLYGLIDMIIPYVASSWTIPGTANPVEICLENIYFYIHIPKKIYANLI